MSSRDRSHCHLCILIRIVSCFSYVVFTECLTSLSTVAWCCHLVSLGVSPSSVDWFSATHCLVSVPSHGVSVIFLCFIVIIRITVIICLISVMCNVTHYLLSLQIFVVTISITHLLCICLMPLSPFV